MDFLQDGPIDGAVHLLLAHGAGAGMDTPFMAFMAQGLAESGVGVTRFEFPYMAARRQDGKKRPPDRAPKLLDCWREVIEACGGPGRVFIGGKSMGGRMASLIAAELPVRGVVCLGYPFHPPGRPEKLRIDHFREVKAPFLICQGERDPFGSRAEVTDLTLPREIAFHWLGDGDHNLKPRKKSGLTESGNWQETVRAVSDYLHGLAD